MMRNLFQFIEGQTHLSTSWHTKMSLTFNELIENVLLVKPPHYLQACTENLPNMECVVCKITNSQPKVMLSLRLTLMYSGILDFILVFSGEGSKCLGNFKCIVCFFSHHIVVHAGRNIGRYVFLVRCTPDFEN